MNYSQSDKKRGMLIRYYRRLRGLTQAELAVRVDVSCNAVYEWEKGAKPTVKHWSALCRELDMPPDYLDMDMCTPVSEGNVQFALLRQLGLPSDIQQELEKAIERYYREEEPLHAQLKPMSTVSK